MGQQCSQLKNKDYHTVQIGNREVLRQARLTEEEDQQTEGTEESDYYINSFESRPIKFAIIIQNKSFQDQTMKTLALGTENNRDLFDIQNLSILQPHNKTDNFADFNCENEEETFYSKEIHTFAPIIISHQPEQNQNPKKLEKSMSQSIKEPNSPHLSVLPVLLTEGVQGVKQEKQKSFRNIFSELSSNQDVIILNSCESEEVPKMQDIQRNFKKLLSANCQKYTPSLTPVKSASRVASSLTPSRKPQILTKNLQIKNTASSFEFNKPEEQFLNHDDNSRDEKKNYQGFIPSCLPPMPNGFQAIQQNYNSISSNHSGKNLNYFTNQSQGFGVNSCLKSQRTENQSIIQFDCFKAQQNEKLEHKLSERNLFYLPEKELAGQNVVFKKREHLQQHTSQYSSREASPNNNNSKFLQIGLVINNGSSHGGFGGGAGDMSFKINFEDVNKRLNESETQFSNDVIPSLQQLVKQGDSAQHLKMPLPNSITTNKPLECFSAVYKDDYQVAPFRFENFQTDQNYSHIETQRPQTTERSEVERRIKTEFTNSNSNLKLKNNSGSYFYRTPIRGNEHLPTNAITNDSNSNNVNMEIYRNFENSQELGINLLTQDTIGKSQTKTLFQLSQDTKALITGERFSFKIDPNASSFVNRQSLDNSSFSRKEEIIVNPLNRIRNQSQESKQKSAERYFNHPHQQAQIDNNNLLFSHLKGQTSDQEEKICHQAAKENNNFKELISELQLTCNQIYSQVNIPEHISKEKSEKKFSIETGQKPNDQVVYVDLKLEDILKENFTDTGLQKIKMETDQIESTENSNNILTDQNSNNNKHNNNSNNINNNNYFSISDSNFIARDDNKITFEARENNQAFFVSGQTSLSSSQSSIQRNQFEKILFDNQHKDERLQSLACSPRFHTENVSHISAQDFSINAKKQVREGQSNHDGSKIQSYSNVYDFQIDHVSKLLLNEVMCADPTLFTNQNSSKRALKSNSQNQLDFNQVDEQALELQIPQQTKKEQNKQDLESIKDRFIDRCQEVFDVFSVQSYQEGDHNQSRNIEYLNIICPPQNEMYSNINNSQKSSPKGDSGVIQNLASQFDRECEDNCYEIENKKLIEQKQIESDEYRSDEQQYELEEEYDGCSNLNTSRHLLSIPVQAHYYVQPSCSETSRNDMACIKEMQMHLNYLKQRSTRQQNEYLKSDIEALEKHFQSLYSKLNNHYSDGTNNTSLNEKSDESRKQELLSDGRSVNLSGKTGWIDETSSIMEVNNSNSSQILSDKYCLRQDLYKMDQNFELNKKANQSQNNNFKPPSFDQNKFTFEPCEDQPNQINNGSKYDFKFMQLFNKQSENSSSIPMRYDVQLSNQNQIHQKFLEGPDYQNINGEGENYQNSSATKPISVKQPEKNQFSFQKREKLSTIQENVSQTDSNYFIDNNATSPVFSNGNACPDGQLTSYFITNTENSNILSQSAITNLVEQSPFSPFSNTLQDDKSLSKKLKLQNGQGSGSINQCVSNSQEHQHDFKLSDLSSQMKLNQIPSSASFSQKSPGLSNNLNNNKNDSSNSNTNSPYYSLSTNILHDQQYPIYFKDEKSISFMAPADRSIENSYSQLPCQPGFFNHQDSVNHLISNNNLISSPKEMLPESQFHSKNQMKNSNQSLSSSSNSQINDVNGNGATQLFLEKSNIKSSISTVGGSQYKKDIEYCQILYMLDPSNSIYKQKEETQEAAHMEAQNTQPSGQDRDDYMNPCGQQTNLNVNTTYQTENPQNKSFSNSINNSKIEDSYKIDHVNNQTEIFVPTTSNSKELRKRRTNSVQEELLKQQPKIWSQPNPVNNSFIFNEQSSLVNKSYCVANLNMSQPQQLVNELEQEIDQYYFNLNDSQSENLIKLEKKRSATTISQIIEKNSIPTHPNDQHLRLSTDTGKDIKVRDQNSFLTNSDVNQSQQKIFFGNEGVEISSIENTFIAGANNVNYHQLTYLESDKQNNAGSGSILNNKSKDIPRNLPSTSDGISQTEYGDCYFKVDPPNVFHQSKKDISKFIKLKDYSPSQRIVTYDDRGTLSNNKRTTLLNGTQSSNLKKSNGKTPRQNFQKQKENQIEEHQLQQLHLNSKSNISLVVDNTPYMKYYNDNNANTDENRQRKLPTPGCNSASVQKVQQLEQKLFQSSFQCKTELKQGNYWQIRGNSSSQKTGLNKKLVFNKSPITNIHGNPSQQGFVPEKNIYRSQDNKELNQIVNYLNKKVNQIQPTNYFKQI